MCCRFFRYLRHSKGEWAGRPLELAPWQVFYLWTLFGWLRADGVRRFRTSYLEVARKNGKSTMGAGIGLYLTVGDGEAGAEVYTAATKFEQARIIHGESIRMVQQSPALARHLTVLKNNIHNPRTFAKFEPLGRDSKTLDGLNVSGAVVDELHAHPTGEMWDVLETATGSRAQPLMVAVTTAGQSRQSICYQFHDYTAKILTGVLENDAWHGMIYTLDAEDVEGWANPQVWVKANPNLGVSKYRDQMEEKARKALGMPARQASFKQKELNIWMQAGARWIEPEAWRACNLGRIDEGALAGRVAFGGLDLASTRDVTALVWVLPTEDGRPWEVLCRFWIPEENVMQRVHDDRVPYDVWIEQGLMQVTPGNVTDYDFIEAQVRADMDLLAVKELAFDPWNATQVSNNLQAAGATMVEFRQGYFTMNPAMKALEVAIQKRGLNHGGNAVLAWMADNVVATEDAAGNLKPDKAKSVEKIDGIVALVMAHGRAHVHTEARRSVYEDREIRVL